MYRCIDGTYEPHFSHVSHSSVMLNTELFVDVWSGVGIAPKMCV